MKRTGILLVIFCAMAFRLSAQWVNQSAGFSAPQAVWHISMPDTNSVWACLYNPLNPLAPEQTVMKTTDGGNTWLPVTVTGAAGFGFSMVFALDAQKAWAVMNHPDSTGGRLLKTTDGGQTWISQDSAVFHNKPKLVYFWDENAGVCIGDPYEGHYEIYTTTDGGSDWNKVDEINLPVSQEGEFTWHESYTVVGDTLWYGGSSNGKVYYSQDRGCSWNLMAAPINEITKVLFKNSLQGLIGRADLTNFSWDLYSTQDGGNTWTEVVPSGIVNYNDLCYVPGTTSSLVSVGNGMSFSDDGGHSWTDFSAPVGGSASYYTTVAFQGPKSGWAGGAMLAGDGGAMFRFSGNPLSTSEQENSGYSLSAFPNPCHGSLSLYTGALLKHKAVLRIYDAMGSVALTRQLDNQCSPGPLVTDVSGLKPGLYVVDIQTGNYFLSTRVMVN